ncbi:hypothetical protein KIW84_073068 [Lathyrus oleraceus]|uniref:magnesium chelatase n=1 Tax=Pisum sativum TaxID=3888 RepID=A0A9D4ZW24_PEA|nr:hypothetical protein KIW84_073068 [Pisum sativum]
MASTLRTSSIGVLSSRHHSPPSIYSLSLTKGKVSVSKFWGGIGFHGVKEKSQFSVLSVATGINSPQQVGWNTVEREGISIAHPARFILIGSGNPEEGELRPQLLDRFGMHAQVGTVREAELRVKIVEERGRFDKNPKEFRDSYEAEQEKLQQEITSARSFLASVEIDHELKVKISQVCADLNVDGLRGDIVTNRAAKALSALKGRDRVSAEDIAIVIPNCLRHRLRKDPLESIDSGLLVIEKFYEVFR